MAVRRVCVLHTVKLLLLLWLLLIITARRSCARAVLGIVMLSVCLSVRPSVTRVLCGKTKQCTSDRIFWYHKKRHCSFLTPTVVGGGRRLFPSEICAQSDPPLWKTPTSTDFAFNSYSWGACVIIKSPKGSSKSDFLFFNQIIRF